MKRLRKFLFVPIALGLFAGSAVPVFADHGSDFVCPVFNSDTVGVHNPNAVPIGGGDFTILPGNSNHLDVPDHATNTDGSGTPPGAHASPGDEGYTAIWKGA